MTVFLAPASWPRQSQSEAGHTSPETLGGIAFPTAASIVTCPWPVYLKNRVLIGNRALRE